MTTQGWRWRDWLVLAWSILMAAIALLAIWPGLGRAWSWVCRNSGNLAAWVQAVGAILAIASGAYAIVWQMKTQAKQAEDLRLEKVRLIASALFQCRKSVISFITMAPGWADATRHAAEAEMWLQSLASIELQDFPGFGAQIVVFHIRAEGQAFLNEIHAVSDVQRVVAIGRGLIKQLEDAEITVENYLKRFGKASPSQAFELDGIHYFPAGRDSPGPTHSGHVSALSSQLSQRLDAA